MSQACLILGNVKSWCETVTYHLDRKMSHFIRDHSDPDFFAIWATKSILQTQTEYAECADTYALVLEQV